MFDWVLNTPLISICQLIYFEQEICYFYYLLIEKMES